MDNRNPDRPPFRGDHVEHLGLMHEKLENLRLPLGPVRLPDQSKCLLSRNQWLLSKPLALINSWSFSTAAGSAPFGSPEAFAKLASNTCTVGSVSFSTSASRGRPDIPGLNCS